MTPTRRVILLVLLMAIVVAAVGTGTVVYLYRVALDGQRERLVETARGRARLIEAILQHEMALQSAAGEPAVLERVLAQLRVAHARFRGFGETGEFTLAQRRGEEIVFLLRHRHYDLDQPKPVEFSSWLAAPMRRALLGQSGTMIGYDYRGAEVLAAYEPSRLMRLGIVAKIDLSEVRAPFRRGALVAAGSALAMILLAAFVFRRVSEPMIRRLAEDERTARVLAEEARMAARTALAAEDRFRRVVEASSNAILTVNPRGRIVLVNTRVESEFGYRREELIGEAIEILVPDRVRDRHPELVRDFFRKPVDTRLTQERRVTGRRRDGSEFPIELVLRPYADVEGVRVLAIVRNISARVQAEEARVRIMEELERRNAELERFAYTVSHELKSPLVTMTNFLGLAEQDACAGESARLAEDLARMRRGAETMQEVIGDLLAYARADWTLPRLLPVPLAEVVAEACERVEGSIVERGACVEVAAGLPVVLGDRARLVEVLQNLLDNAVKYMGEQVEPSIEIGWRADAEGGGACFVRDNGAGIESGYQDRIFGLFERLDPRVDGTGVGLALVKRIVETHGGWIRVESDGPGTGTTFVFALPLAKEEGSAGPVSTRYSPATMSHTR